MRCLFLLLLASGVALGQAANAPAAGQRCKLVTSTLVLAPGQTSAAFPLEIVASGLPTDKSKPAKPVLADAGTPASPDVKITPEFVSSSNLSAPTQLWKFKVKVADFPAAETQSRLFVVSYGDLHESIPYTLTNVAGKTFTWSVKAAPEWNVGSQSALDINIRTGDLPATSLLLQGAEFSSDDKQKRTLGAQHFALCGNASEPCAPITGTLEAKHSYTAYLRPSSSLPVGTFKGAVRIGAGEKTEPEALALTIYSPRPRGWLWGLGALGLGVLLSMLLQVGLRSWFHRKEERQVIVLLRSRLDELEKEFGKLAANLKTAAAEWSNQATNLRNDMSDKNIRPLLRPLVPAPFEAEVAAMENFKTKVEEFGSRFSHLRLLLREGLEKVNTMQTQHPGHQDAMNESAETIARLPPIPGALEEIRKELVALRTKAAVPATLLLAAARGATPEDELHSISAQLLAASLAAWLFWGAVAVLSGALFLVYQNPSFGTPYDLLVCLVWGLGVSVAGQQAPNVTPSSLAGSIGIKFPGAK